MDTIKSFCTEQNQTDYRNFDTGITVIFVMQNLLFWKWWIFPWFSRPSVSYGVFPTPLGNKRSKMLWFVCSRAE